jgi:hypothetical protein
VVVVVDVVEVEGVVVVVEVEGVVVVVEVVDVTVVVILMTVEVEAVVVMLSTFGGLVEDIGPVSEVDFAIETRVDIGVDLA